MSSEIVSQLILAVALAIVSLLAFAARQLIQLGIEYLKSKIGQSKYERLRDFSAVAVKAIEQTPIYKDFTGEKKKELAKVAVVQWAQEHSLPINDALCDKFIEAAVHEMNAQVSQIDWLAGEIISGPDASELGSVGSYGAAD